jgi:hypothetical protein
VFILVWNHLVKVFSFGDFGDETDFCSDRVLVFFWGFEIMGGFLWYYLVVCTLGDHGSPANQDHLHGAQCTLFGIAGLSQCFKRFVSLGDVVES